MPSQVNLTAFVCLPKPEFAICTCTKVDNLVRKILPNEVYLTIVRMQNGSHNILSQSGKPKVYFLLRMRCVRNFLFEEVAI